MTPNRIPRFFCLLMAACLLESAGAGGIFSSSDTFVVTNPASAAIAVTDFPTSGGANMPWHPSCILANFRDSPTGAVLIVRHVRAGVRNPHVSTNTISITNALHTSATGAVSALVWDPDGRYTVVPPNDSLLINTSSTNAEIILLREVQR